MKDSLSPVSALTGLSGSLIALSQGALKIPLYRLQDPQYRDIWLNIRLPRVLLAILVGQRHAHGGMMQLLLAGENRHSFFYPTKSIEKLFEDQ